MWNLLRPSKEEIEVPEFEAYALPGLADELIVAGHVLRIYPGVRWRQQEASLALARLDHERAQGVWYGSAHFELRCRTNKCLPSI